jgi:hypothetical protein
MSSSDARLPARVRSRVFVMGLDVLPEAIACYRPIAEALIEKLRQADAEQGARLLAEMLVNAEANGIRHLDFLDSEIIRSLFADGAEPAEPLLGLIKAREEKLWGRCGKPGARGRKANWWL